MTDLDPRIQRALDGLSASSAEAHAQARRAALDALPTPARARRPRWRLVAACAAATLVTGGALAATNRLELRVGKPAPVEVTKKETLGVVTLPPGATGLTVVAGGRMWLKTRSGLGVQGLAVTTAELSPNALYVAVGIGHSLVAMAPDGRRAWTHDAGGRVVAVAWAPNPIVVAYVVEVGARRELHVIEGNGDNDRLVDRDVADARPSWRADTLAMAYVDADSHARVADYPSLATRKASTGPIDALAYPPAGDGLVVEQGGPSLALSDAAQGADYQALVPSARVVGLAWTAPDQLIVAGDEGAQSRVWVVGGNPLIAKVSGSRFFPEIDAIAPIVATGQLAVGVPVGAERQIWQVEAPQIASDESLAPQRVLLRLPESIGPIEAISIR